MGLWYSPRVAVDAHELSLADRERESRLSDNFREAAEAYPRALRESPTASYRPARAPHSPDAGTTPPVTLVMPLSHAPHSSAGFALPVVPTPPLPDG